MDTSNELLAKIDKMLALTVFRDAFTSTEVSDFCLDLRNDIVREPTLELEAV